MKANRWFHWAWVILGISFVILFINYSVRLGFGVVMPEMIRTLGFSRTASGTIYNFYLFAYITATPFTGYLTDRLGARRVMTFGVFIVGLGTLLMGTAQSLLAACLFFGITGLGSSGIWTPVLTIIQRWFAHHRRGLAMGLVSTGYGLGFAVMGVVFPWIVASYNWRFAWYFLGAMALTMVLVGGIFLRSDPAESGLHPWGHTKIKPDKSPSSTYAQKQIPLSNLFRNSRFWIIGVSYFSVSYTCYAVTTFIVDYAKYQLDIPLEKAAFLATAHGIGQIIGVLTILPMSDFIGRKKTTIISNAFIAASVIGILAVGNAWGLLIVFVGCMGIFYGATFPIYGLCAGDYFPKQAIGTVVGAWTPFYGAGAIAGHWVTGILRDNDGIYDQGFLISIFTAATALVLMALVRKQVE
jgi:sugar phosphate permease